jgi:hypothetical protein
MGCSVGSGNWNDHIDPTDREKIKVLNSKIIDALAENNPTKLKEVSALLRVSRTCSGSIKCK